MFFGIDWDLKPEINIHTLHRTEHLLAIYFKGRVTFSTRKWGGGVVGEVKELSRCWLVPLREEWGLLVADAGRGCTPGTHEALSKWPPLLSINTRRMC